MPLFDIPKRNISDAEILNKAKSKKVATTTKSGGNISSRIATASALVKQHLGKYANETIVINTEDELCKYIDTAINNGIIGIDTETTGLDPILDDLVGVCLYTYGEKTAYVPVGHLSYITQKKLKNQLDIDILTHQLERLVTAGTKIIMFNAVFDIRVIKNATGVLLECFWDTYLAARCLNENEPSNSLKPLHQKYVLRGKEDAFKFGELFKGINFAYVPVDIASLYAAHDAKITVELYDYQKQFLYVEPECLPEDRNGMNGVSWVFFNIEMPVVKAVVELEENGIAFDREYNAQLKEKYHALLDEKLDAFNKACDMYADEIEAYKAGTCLSDVYVYPDGKTSLEKKNKFAKTTGNKVLNRVKLDDPININSVPQLQALLYDIAKIEPIVDKKTKKPTRSTSEETLTKLKHPLADAILAYREFSTIVSTFIDKMPECVNPKDGRVHCKFNQYGADTGRFSSNNPNMQNLPSSNHDIRPMFVATHYDKQVDFDTDEFLEVDKFTELQTDDGWVKTSTLSIGDKFSIDGDIFTIRDIEIGDSTVRIFL